MDAGRDCTDVVKNRDASHDKSEGGRVDTCAQKATILLKDLDVDVYL